MKLDEAVARFRTAILEEQTTTISLGQPFGDQENATIGFDWISEGKGIHLGRRRIVVYSFVHRDGDTNWAVLVMNGDTGKWKVEENSKSWGAGTWFPGRFYLKKNQAMRYAKKQMGGVPGKMVKGRLQEPLNSKNVSG